MFTQERRWQFSDISKSCLPPADLRSLLSFPFGFAYGRLLPPVGSKSLRTPWPKATVKQPFNWTLYPLTQVPNPFPWLPFYSIRGLTFGHPFAMDVSNGPRSTNSDVVATNRSSSQIPSLPAVVARCHAFQVWDFSSVSVHRRQGRVLNPRALQKPPDS